MDHRDKRRSPYAEELERVLERQPRRDLHVAIVKCSSVERDDIIRTLKDSCEALQRREGE